MSLVYEFVFLFLLFSHLMLVVLGGGDGKNEYKGERKCPSSFSCGYLGNISFPFTTTERPDCGLLPVRNCADDHPKMIQLQNKEKWFAVVKLSQFPESCLFRDMDLYTLLQSRSCDVFRHNYTLPHPTSFQFVSLHIKFTATIFSCNRTLHVTLPKHFHNYTKCPDHYDLYYSSLISAETNASSVAALGLASCNMVQLPTKDVADADDPFTFITADIYTEVNITHECAICHYKKRGRCQLDSNQKFCCANGMIKQKSLKHKHT